MTVSVSSKKRRRRGAILLDALIGVGVLALGASAIYALVPTVHKSHVIGDHKARAIQMASRMVQNIQMLSASQVTADVLTDLKLIDAGQTASPYSFTNIPLDDGARYSPATALPQGKGTLTVAPLSDGAVKATVEVSWKGPSGTTSYKVGTVVGGYR